ncbi:branched-chain-amino-acid transaminase [Jannaschia seohaensis]|uniref:Branched-chain-amino-acid aminotransferase n=1 Tax=Jannaschia seohaensis TaxID=475081 RepID=A0A2Y9AK46_9RHOB|nr:branched-chain-amino-acid transaminase [Jannaschia seohaensis]PWJ20604.1 branched-chain amino acid aminotransferase [Jannaschia seohaensis]SSA44700.1 branched-chain amino acid aminotransferase [Jannaschia seohaensis]
MAGGAIYPVGYLDGAYIPAGDVRLPLLAPGVTYAASVFEGVRGYVDHAGKGVNLFRLGEHMERLVRSTQILGLDDIPSAEEMGEVTLGLMARNGVREDCYIRIQVYLGGDGEMTARGPTGLAILARPRPQLADRLANGIRCQVSSWRRNTDNASPVRAKAAANYLNSRLAGLQAKADGYDTALILTESGTVSEAPGACLFMVRDNVLITPPVTSGILESLTRDTILRRARALGIVDDVVERPVDRTELYAASEVMLVGTGMEVVPVVGIDRLTVGSGARGPITRALQDDYFAIVRGGRDAPAQWLSPIPDLKETPQ